MLSSPETMLQEESATILYFIIIPRSNLVIGFLRTDVIVSATDEDVKIILR